MKIGLALATAALVAPSLVPTSLVAKDTPPPPAPDAPIELRAGDGSMQPLAVDDILTIALFLRPEQEWSKKAITALAEVRAALPAAERARTRLVAVWVVATDDERWHPFGEPWVELLDTARVAARHQKVVAYPTTAVIRGDGSTLVRIPSLPPDCSRRLGNELRAALGLPPLADPTRTETQPWRRHLHLAERLRDKGESVAAVDALAEAERLGAERSEWLPVRATLALDLSDLDGARAWIEELIALAPEEPATTFLRGRLARLEGRFADAEVLLRPLLAIAPHRIDLILEFGAVLEGLGRFEEAAKLYRRALEGVDGRE